jgi:hypothetical protein
MASAVRLQAHRQLGDAKAGFCVVGATGFEPATFRPPAGAPSRQAVGVDASGSVPRVPIVPARRRSGRIGRISRYQTGTKGSGVQIGGGIRLWLPPAVERVRLRA